MTCRAITCRTRPVIDSPFAEVDDWLSDFRQLAVHLPNVLVVDVTWTVSDDDLIAGVLRRDNGAFARQPTLAAVVVSRMSVHPHGERYSVFRNDRDGAARVSDTVLDRLIAP